MWERQTIELGDILEKSIHEVSFRHLQALEIVKMTATCGCTKPVYNAGTQTIDVTYKAGKVPKHLRYKGSFSIKKVVKVFTPVGRQDLEIRATIKMPHVYGR